MCTPSISFYAWCAVTGRFSKSKAAESSLKEKMKELKKANDDSVQENRKLQEKVRQQGRVRVTARGGGGGGGM